MYDSFPSFGPDKTPDEENLAPDDPMGRVALKICGMDFWHLNRPKVASVLETNVLLEGSSAFLWYTQISPYTTDKVMLFCKDPGRPRPFLLTRLPKFRRMNRVELIAAMLVLVRERVDPFWLFCRDGSEMQWFEIQRLARRWETLAPEVEEARIAFNLPCLSVNYGIGPHERGPEYS